MTLAVHDLGPIRDREPPNDHAAEANVLGAALVDDAARATILGALSATDYHLPAHAEIHSAIAAVERRDGAVDTLTVRAELQARARLHCLTGGELYLSRIASSVEVSTLVNVGPHVARVRQCAQLRRVIRVLAEGQGRAYGAADLSLVGDIAAELEKIERSSALASALPATVADAAAIVWTSPLPAAIPTPWGAVDRLIGGGLRGVTVLVAPSGVGKTGWALQCGRYVARSGAVLYVSTELSDRQVLARIAAQILRRSWRELHDSSDPGTVAQIVDAFRDLRMFIRRFRDLEDTLSIADSIAAKSGGSCMLILDYLQGAARDSSVDRRIAVGSVMQSITEWAAASGNVALVVSSTARASYSADDRHGRDLVSTAKEAGEVEYMADTVLYLKSDQCQLGGEAEAQLSVAKARWGALGDVGLTFHGPTGTYRLAAAQELSDLDRKVVSAIRAGHQSRNAVATYCRCRRDRVLDAVEGLIQRGVIKEIDRHLALNDANLREPLREPVPESVPSSEPLFDSPTVTGGSRSGSRSGTTARNPEVVPRPLGREPESGTGIDEDAI